MALLRRFLARLRRAVRVLRGIEPEPPRKSYRREYEAMWREIPMGPTLPGPREPGGYQPWR